VKTLAGVKRVALAGNPNTGKTTLFNRLTGSNAKVGNYPGVTVERQEGTLELPRAGRIELLDVPGTYSLSARSAEEQLAICYQATRHVGRKTRASWRMHDWVAHYRSSAAASSRHRGRGFDR
jgi:small GTP-binding protein